jgi:hypothetical protein
LNRDSFINSDAVSGPFSVSALSAWCDPVVSAPWVGLYSIAGSGFATFFMRPWLLLCLALQSCVWFSLASDAPCTQETRCRAGFLLCLALFGFTFSPTVCIARSNETRFLVTLVFRFCVGSLQGEVGIALKSSNQNTRGFVVQIVLPWWFSKRVHQVFGEIPVRI